jgi:hypothetical protein
VTWTRFTIPKVIESIGDDCFDRVNEFYIEAGSNLKEFGKDAIATYEARFFRIPPGVESLGPSCFLGLDGRCDLSFDISFEGDSKVKEFGKYCFGLDITLRSIKIPASVETIGDWCFDWCDKLEELTFESGSKLKRIGNECFGPDPNYRRKERKKGLTSIEIPASVEVIGKECFKDQFLLRKVHFAPNSLLREIGAFAFRGTKVPL